MKPATTLAAVIFVFVALLHAVRLALGWEVQVSGVTIPMWVSAIGLVVTGALALLLWREARH